MSANDDVGSAAPLSRSQIPATLQQGLTLLNQGRAGDAHALACRVLATDDSLPDAHFLAGLALQRAQEHDGAVDSFHRIVELDSGNAAAWAHLAESLIRLKRYSAADAALDKAIDGDEGNPVVHQVIALAFSSLSEHERALSWYRKSVEAQPSNVGFLLNLANCEMYCGQLDKAEATLTAALDVEPAQPNVHWLLSVVRRATDRRHIDVMRSLVATGRYRPQGLALLHYACGKELEDLEAWAEAFDAFAKGAAAKRSTIDYDEAQECAVFDLLTENLTANWLDDSTPGCASRRPIFIVGQPRSGTTLVERIVTAHSRVHSAGELRQFGDCLAELSGNPDAGRLSLEVARTAHEVDPATLGEAYLDASARFAGDVEHFVDKQPGNFLYLPLILKALPNARIVHLARSPMDTCFSVFKQLFTGAYPYSYDLGETGRHYARYYSLMQTWRERFGDRFHDVSYEAIAADPEPHTRALLDFLGLPFESACLAFHEQAAPVTTASAVQVRKAAHTKSVGRWRRYETQLAPLRQVLLDNGVPLDGPPRAAE